MNNTANLTGVKGSPRRPIDWAYIGCVLAIALLSCLINFGGISQSEVIDDHDLLHSRVARGCGRNPIDCFKNPQFGLYYRPIMGASFSVGENLHGQSPLPFHVENLLLHAIVMLEACWAFRLLLPPRAALLASLFYAVHPLQVPVTTFIGGRTDSLAMLFILWYVIGCLKGRKGRFAVAWRAAAFVGFTGAIFCKEQCALLALLLPLLSIPQRSSGTQSLQNRYLSYWWMLLYLVPIGALLAAAKRVIPSNAIDTVAWKPTDTQVAWDLSLRIEMVGRTIWYYVRCFLWPTVDTLHQSSLGAWDIPQPLTALGGFFAIGIWIAIIRYSWPKPGARLFALWFLLTLTPCLNILPIPSQFASCYRAAIPLLGMAGMAGVFCDRFVAFMCRRRGVILAFAVPTVLGAVLALMAAMDVPVWRSDEAVTQAEYKGDPNFLPALTGYAISLRRQGRFKEAVEANNRVVSRLFLDKNTVEERIALIDTRWMLRHVKSLSSLRYQPRFFINYVLRERGGALQDMGMFLPAIDDYRVALAATPQDLDVADALIFCCDTSGKYELEREVLETVVKRYPTSARLYRLGSTYAHLEKWAEAKQTLARALDLAVRDPNGNTAAIWKLYQKAEARDAAENKLLSSPRSKSVDTP